MRGVQSVKLSKTLNIYLFITPHAHARAGGYVIGAGVHIYIYVYIYILYLWTKKNLNRTLAIDSPFQTFAVGLLVKFTD